MYVYLTEQATSFLFVYLFQSAHSHPGKAYCGGTLTGRISTAADGQATGAIIKCWSPGLCER